MKYITENDLMKIQSHIDSYCDDHEKLLKALRPFVERYIPESIDVIDKTLDLKPLTSTGLTDDLYNHLLESAVKNITAAFSYYGKEEN